MAWWSRWLVVMFVAFFAVSCATDEVPNEEETNNGERVDPNACANLCMPGETRCDGDTVQACAADNKGCFDWADGVDCAAEGTQCDDSAEPAICLTEPGTCQDGEVNQDESDLDCGGQRCAACGLGRRCDSADDCTTNNCDLGVTDECVPEDQETCTDGTKNQDETDVDCGGAVCPACGENAECTADADCESGACTDNKCEPPDVNMGCNPGEVRCTGNTVQTCDQNQWVESQICAQACVAGACDDDVQCTPGTDRCFKNSVQTCNVAGSAWQHLDICEEDCDLGLCVGACEPQALRCNGNTQEMCGSDGQTWAMNESCSLGCDHRVCIEDKLENKGVPMTLTGTHVYQGCVSIELGGTIDVPDGETLEIWAKCLNVTDSSSITIGSGGTFIFHAEETITNGGTISGGDFIRLDAYTTLTNSGEVSATRVELRGDVLTNEMDGTIGGSNAFLLYGSEFTNDGTATGTESVMPPETLSSPTHPEGFQWNMVADDVSVAWDKPFASVKGYYVNVNASAVPGPSDGEFTNAENVTVPLSRFRPGSNVVQVVSVNADSTVGTVPARFTVEFNVSSPTISSDSHADPSEWMSVDDVFLEWSDAASVDPDSFVGYWYMWDHRGDTRPNEQQGTFRNDNKILMNDQAPGVWTFHIVNIDRLGRTSPVPSRYQLRIGPSPGFGNIAGTVTDQNGDPVRGASVTLNGGVYRVASVSSGDYTFRGEVPAAAFDWDVQVSAPGFVTQNTTLRMTPNKMEVLDFQLQPSSVDPVYELGFEIVLSDNWVSSSIRPDVAVGRPGEIIWSDQSNVVISTTTGVRLMQSSISGYYSARRDVGFDGNHYFLAYTGRYNSYYYRPAVRFWDTAHDEVGSGVLSSWGTGYGTSLVWDGSNFVLVAADSYNMQIGTVDPLDPTTSTPNEMFSASASSYNRSLSLYDGSAIATFSANYYSSDYDLNFARYAKDGTQVQAPLVMGRAKGSTWQGFAFDGRKYHVAYRSADEKSNGKYPLILRNVDASGTLSMPLEVAAETATSYRGAALAFDGSNLLLTYVKDGRGYLEVRSPADYAIVQSFELGDVSHVNLDFGYHAGSGVLIYRAGSKLYGREVYLR